jgi:hypothetical protein
LAEIVRLDHAHHRQVAGNSPMAEAVKPDALLLLMDKLRGASLDRQPPIEAVGRALDHGGVHWRASV